MAVAVGFGAEEALLAGGVTTSGRLSLSKVAVVVWELASVTDVAFEFASYTVVVVPAGVVTLVARPQLSRVKLLLCERASETPVFQPRPLTLIVLVWLLASSMLVSSPSVLCP